MKLRLTLKTWIVIIAGVFLLSGGLAYAGHAVFDVNVTATVEVQLKVPEGIQVYEDGTLQNVVASLVFDDVAMPLEGPVVNPDFIPVFVQNHTFEAVEVGVDDDYVVGPNGVDITTLFGPTTGSLQTSPGNVFTLQPEGASGDGIPGYVGIHFTQNSPATYSFNIVFKAVLPSPP